MRSLQLLKKGDHFPVLKQQKRERRWDKATAQPPIATQLPAEQCPSGHLADQSEHQGMGSEALSLRFSLSHFMSSPWEHCRPGAATASALGPAFLPTGRCTDAMKRNYRSQACTPSELCFLQPHTQTKTDGKETAPEAENCGWMEDRLQ